MSHLLRSLLYSLFLLSIFFGNGKFLATARCLDEQSSLLLQLKANLSFSLGLIPSKISSWDSNTDCCSWEGVTCDDNVGHVIGLNLSSEFISGGIDNSSSLFSLRYLQNLNLAINAFNSSPIPSGFDRLLHLTTLNLSNSGFGGQIPIEFSRLTRLVSLDLSTLFVGELPLKLEQPGLKELIQNLSELRTLSLDGVNISAPGSYWAQALSSSVPNLQVLGLSNCHLSGPLDFSLSNLRFLSDIRLDLNDISAEVPEFFANFTNLTSLSLSSCGLRGKFPEKILQLRTLQTLDVSVNPKLGGSLPEFPKGASFRMLRLSGTSFTRELPDSIGNLKFLTSLEIWSCNFYGAIPVSLVRLTKLVSLDLSSNNFSGTVPWLGLPENLAEIFLYNNRLTGSIHSVPWNRFLKLENLHLRNNSLTGTIPSSLFTLPSLKQLHLAHNQFVGPLSESSNASLSPLAVLDLSSNNLEGPIPTSFFELQNLATLLLSFNNFNGTVHLENIQKLGNLSSLDLSYNRLSVNTSVSDASLSSFPEIGVLSLASCNLTEFPSFLRINQPIIRFLDLSNNKIHGVVPNWIWNVGNGLLVHLNLSCNFLDHLEEPLPNPNYSSGLVTIDLHSNLLQGPLPILSSSAVYLDYSNNNFTSTIPANISSYLSYTIFFSVSNNRLHGEIPTSICNASYLQVLDLSNNNLSHMIPTCLGSITWTLRVLNLGHNNFKGSIPQTFPVGCGLRTLDLNGNVLEGSVPTTLGNCKMLEVLDLGNNQINDTFPFWLESLLQLRVLILRSNHFHGPIRSTKTDHTFPSLQIIDLSSNDFVGNLSSEIFLSWKAMTVEGDEIQSEHKIETVKFKFLEFSQVYYQDSDANK
uniref:Leucine-rich repeat-containing N-terminal plant-type domain-containing protein n=1 Tax=Nelumbo nucifera TaxID=4432 RepID=A0A822Y9R3_NELNU|nr:TPA_asm: hypothetical protein HUJ06_030605 [Nelumbo nucifera]